ncbi:MAG: serine hydroxymethyltransferase [Desulfobacterales bacterium]|jgi:glycine hydroxymethyltransferase|nr:serine hydroxymethyltransferase [Desulfobacterales bacterium]
MPFISHDDPAVAALIEKERERQESTLNLIAAENTAPAAVLEALGSSFNNKTAEGYPGRRYHTGCRVTDELEQLAVERAKALFEAGHANVQPHSGVNANLAVYGAVLNPGDKILSMKLSHGGHLSHGDAASITGRIFQASHYGVDPKTERLDYDAIRGLALEIRPRMLVAGASSYPRLIDYQALRAIADEVSAYLLVDMAHIAGLVAAQVIPSPVPHAHFVTFTTYKTLMGPHGGVILCAADLAKKIDRSIFPGTQGTPTLALVAAKAVCFRLAATPEFRAVQEGTLRTAALLAAELGATGGRPVSGGTDNHMVLADLRGKGLKGDTAEAALEAAGILCNRNVIPFDPESTLVTSGLRFGTPGISSRGMGTEEVKLIAGWIDRILSKPGDISTQKRVRGMVSDLCRRFPLRDRLEG